jgi:pimeloyl-ACP methyl ester carboxylesterase
VMHRLMTEVLGYKEYGAHGGDTGSPLAQALGLAYPDHLKALHLTDIGWHVLATVDPSTLSEKEQEYTQAQEMESYVEGAYVMIQGTKPQTLAYGLNDSPIGLAGWILEKFHTWSDGDLDTAYTKDELLTNIMIYWVTQTINSSIRWYYNGMQDQTFAGGERVEVPVGLALFPKEGIPPRELAERNLNVQHWTEMERGGHFAAMEVPDLLAADLQAFFRTVR